MTKPSPQPTRSRLLMTLLALTAALLAFACGASEPEAPEVSADFRLSSLDGSEISPADFAGKVVLVDFWATWCIPCHKQAEILKEVWREVEGDSVQFLAVDLGEDEATVKAFLDKNPYPYPVLLDPQDNLTYELGIFGLPTLMVVDRQGEVTYFETGMLEEADVRRLLAEAGA